MSRASLIALLVLAACGAPPSQGHRDGGADGGSGPHRADDVLQACADGGAVDSIFHVVQRLNALPPPVSVACFVAGIPRPLNVVAANSTFSAQPAVDAHNPRIFLLQPGIVITVVPAGDGAKLIELGQWDTSTRTLKGELAMPATGPLALDAPLTRVAQDNFTSSCGICHRDEAAATTVDGGYVSDAYRPNPGQEISLTALSAEHQACIASGDPSDRCELFHAIFDFGPVRQSAFSPNVALFIQ